MSRRHNPIEFHPEDLESLRRLGAAAVVILVVLTAMAVFTPERPAEYRVMVTATSHTD